MPRRARAVEAGMIYHVLNRGNGRMRLFLKDGDYAAFIKVLSQGLKRVPVDLLAFCLMPNHWHLVLRPHDERALAGLMHWVGVTHVRRHHQHYRHSAGGHLYQGRFKSFPVEMDAHFLILCRYVEANALRAGLCERAELWPWCSLQARLRRRKDLPLVEWPVDRPRNWTAKVNEPLADKQLNDLRSSVTRGRPFGKQQWVEETAKRLGLTFTLRSPGRPTKGK